MGDSSTTITSALTSQVTLEGKVASHLFSQSEHWPASLLLMGIHPTWFGRCSGSITSLRHLAPYFHGLPGMYQEAMKKMDDFFKGSVHHHEPEDDEGKKESEDHPFEQG
jgi:hypothetical protein